MADISAVFGILLFLGIAFPGLLTAWYLLFPATVERVRLRLDRTPWQCFFVGGVITVQANIGKCTPGAALGGAVQKFLEVLLAQEEHVVDQCGFLWVSHRAGSRNAKPATWAGFRGSGERDQMAMPGLQPVTV